MELTMRRDTTFSFRSVILNILTNADIKNKDAEIRGKYPLLYAAIRDRLFDNMRTASVRIRVIKTATNVDEFAIEEKVTPVLTITSENPMNFAADGGEGLITYSKNVKDEVIPEVSAQDEWVKPAQPGDSTAMFTVIPNDQEEARSTKVMVKAYDKTHEIVVNQEAKQPEPVMEQPEPADTVVVAPVDSVSKKPFYMSVKTNMLYDAAIVPNIGVEFYLGQNFSIAGNWMYSWWKKDATAWYWRTYGGDLAVRYWLGKAAKEKPLTGHHVGLYGQMLTYDFEVGNKGLLADKWSWSVGAEYGYSLPVAKRLNIDFTVGAGFHWGIFEEYLPIDGHYVWQATKKRQYMGPTKLEISLVWLLGRGNVNEGKGGKR